MNELFNMVNKAIERGTSLMVGYTDQYAVMYHRISPKYLQHDEEKRFVSIIGEESSDGKELFNFSYEDSEIDSKDKKAINIKYADGRVLAIIDTSKK